MNKKLVIGLSLVSIFSASCLALVWVTYNMNMMSCTKLYSINNKTHLSCTTEKELTENEYLKICVEGEEDYLQCGIAKLDDLDCTVYEDNSVGCEIK